MAIIGDQEAQGRTAALNGKEGSNMDKRITCEVCRKRLKDLQAYTLPGNPARPGMGHVMFFDHSGRIALCILPKQRSPQMARNIAKHGYVAECLGSNTFGNQYTLSDGTVYCTDGGGGFVLNGSDHWVVAIFDTPEQASEVALNLRWNNQRVRVSPYWPNRALVNDAQPWAGEKQ